MIQPTNNNWLLVSKTIEGQEYEYLCDCMEAALDVEEALNEYAHKLEVLRLKTRGFECNQDG